MCAATDSWAQQIEISGANRTIEVTATGTAERRADAAIAHVGYHVYGPTSDEAYTKAAAISKAVVSSLEQLGVAEEAIESENQSTGATQDYQNGNLPPLEAAQRKFEAQQNWTVHASSDRVAKLLAAAVSAGANQSGAIDWSTANAEELNAEAAAKALQHARAIAEQMAAGLGAKLGPLVYASNQAPEVLRVFSYNGPPPAVKAIARSLPELSLRPPMQRSSTTVRAVFSIQ